MKPQYLKLATILAASLLIAACGGKKDKKAGEDSKKVYADSTKAISVVTTVVQPVPFEDWGTYSAELRGTDDAVLAAPGPAGGRVNKVSSVGTVVSKGQALCDIEADLYGAQLKQAQAAAERIVEGAQVQGKELKDQALRESKEEVAKLIVLGIERTMQTK